MGNSRYVSVVNVVSERRDGGYWILKSDNLPGLLLCGKVLKQLFDDVPAAIKMLYKLNYDMEVNVTEAATDPRLIGKTDRDVAIPHHPGSWVAYPSQECHA